MASVDQGRHCYWKKTISLHDHCTELTTIHLGHKRSYLDANQAHHSFRITTFCSSLGRHTFWPQITQSSEQNTAKQMQHSNPCALNAATHSPVHARPCLGPIIPFLMPLLHLDSRCSDSSACLGLLLTNANKFVYKKETK